MVAKIIPNHSSGFGNICAYTMDRKEAKTIHSEGLRINGSTQFITEQLNMYANSNSRVKYPVGHIVLSFSKELNGKLSENLQKFIAMDYLTKMDIKNTALAIVAHSDKSHPHVHIIYSKVDFNNQKINDSHSKLKSLKAVNELNLKYSLKRELLHSPFTDSKSKYYVAKKEIKYALNNAINGKNKAENWGNLTKQLNLKGINTEFKYKGHSTEIQGISFSKGDFRFKGSEIGREFSYSKIDQALQYNQGISVSIRDTIPIPQIEQESIKPEEQNLSFNFPFQIGQNTLAEQENQEQRKKRKQKLKY